MEPKEIRKEEIYLCKKCLYPLSYSSSIQEVTLTYGETILKKLESNNQINPSLHKCIFAISSDKDLDKNICYKCDFKKNKIFCKNDNNYVGFILPIPEDIIGVPLFLGFLHINEVEINEIGFKNKKKEIPVISQAQYTALAKLKQLRYYVKQLAPTLKESMELINEEKRNIYCCEDKFDKYKLNIALDKIKEIQEIEKNKENEKKEDNINIKKGDDDLDLD